MILVICVVPIITWQLFMSELDYDSENKQFMNCYSGSLLSTICVI